MCSSKIVWCACLDLNQDRPLIWAPGYKSGRSTLSYRRIYSGGPDGVRTRLHLIENQAARQLAFRATNLVWVAGTAPAIRWFQTTV